MSDHGSMDRFTDEERTQQQAKIREDELGIDDGSDDELALAEAEAEAEEEMLRLQLQMQDRERSKFAERRAALAQTKREVERLKLQLADHTNDATVEPPFVSFSQPAAQHQPSNRVLDFGTPYTSSGADMYGRATSKPITKPVRRQTLAVVDQLGDEDDMSIRVPMPEKFDGSGLLVASNDPSESVQVRLALSLDAIVDYIEYSCDSKSVVLSERQFVKVASRFLSGTAAGVYKDLKLIAQQEAARSGDAVPALVTWPQLRRALELRFGRPQPGHQLIRSMFKLKQKANESVESFTVRFDSLHMELTRQNLASRDLSIALYLEGLLPSLQERVEEVVNSIDYCERENIGEHEARKAITALQRLAAAREAHVHSAARQVSHSKPVHNQQQPSTQNKPNGGSPGVQNSVNRPVNVPDALYAQRIAAGLCGKCNSSDHLARDCKRARNLDPVVRRVGARANMMASEEGCTNSTDPTQDQKK